MTLSALLATAEYADLLDADAVALVNQQRHAITIDAWHTYRSLAGRHGIGVDATRRLIQTMDAASVADPLVGEMRHSLRGGEGINANDPSTQAMIDAFAANADLPLTIGDAAAIKTLADATESDADRYALGTVEEKHIRWARGN